MRVISGNVRGKKLKSPEDEKVRPTLDRVKENIFNIIGPKIRNSVVLDLFAGSGALGIEALSRGAGKCYFVDNSKKSIELVKLNLCYTGLEANSEIFFTDADNAIKNLYNRGEKIDYIFVDPPYSKGIVQNVLKQLEKYNIINKEGIVIIETDKTEILPDTIHSLIKIKDREYSNTRISIFNVGEP